MYEMFIDKRDVDSMNFWSDFGFMGLFALLYSYLILLDFISLLHEFKRFELEKFIELSRIYRLNLLILL